MKNLNEPVNILLVEDDDIDVKHIKNCFAEFNIVHPLFVARDGVEALDKIYGSQQEVQINPPPSIILLDLNMPRMNGFEFLRKLRKDSRFINLPVFIVTTSNSPEDRHQASELNASGYFIKPLDFQAFILAYQETLEKSLN